MRIRWIGSGEPDEGERCEAFGLTFERGVWVRPDRVPAKLLANPRFESEGAARPSPKRAPAKSRRREAE